MDNWSDVHRFNSVTNTFTSTVTTNPTGLNGACFATRKDSAGNHELLFSTGGYNDGCLPTCGNSAMYILDLDSMIWTVGPNLVEGRHYPSCAYANGKLWIFGGEYASGNVEKLDIGSNTVSQIAASSWTQIGASLGTTSVSSSKAIYVADVQTVFIFGGYYYGMQKRVFINAFQKRYHTQR